MSKERVNSEPEMVKWSANEGARISKVVANIENANFEDQAQTDLRNNILALWENPRAFRKGLKQGWFD